MTTGNKKVMAAVFGYGHSLEKDRRAFLNKIVEAILDGQISAVIASGGCTSRKNNPGVSEVAIIYAYLHKELIDKGYRLVPKFWMGEYCSPYDLERINLICKTYPRQKEEELQEIYFYFEDCARTTRENVLFMKRLLEKYKVWKNYELVAYCNKAHRIKITALAICVWHYSPRATTYSFKSDFKEYLKQCLVAIPTVLALKNKTLRKIENDRREKQMDES